MTLTDLNSLAPAELRQELTKCCGSSNWVNQMEQLFPVESKEALLAFAEQTWEESNEEDWKEAFLHHPQIGDVDALKEKFATTSDWAMGEQAGVQSTTNQVLEELALNNQRYFEKFGYIFIVCASGKSAEEMLSMLKLRLLNEPENELRIAMEEQNKITLLRLQKLLS